MDVGAEPPSSPGYATDSNCFVAVEATDETAKGVPLQEVSGRQREEHFGEEEEDSGEYTKLVVNYSRCCYWSIWGGKEGLVVHVPDFWEFLSFVASAHALPC